VTDLLFPKHSFTPDAEISIKRLRSLLSSHAHLPDERALQLAKYLIEPLRKPTHFSEDHLATQSQVCTRMSAMVGDFKPYFQADTFKKWADIT
jgi:hypothetical protein